MNVLFKPAHAVLGRAPLSAKIGILLGSLVAGLLVWIPLVITIWVLKVIFDALDHALLLLPVELTRRKGVRDQYLLQAESSVAQVNPVLRQQLRLVKRAPLLEDVDEAHQVAVDVGVRVRQRVAHSGLRGEVDHPRRPLGLAERAQVGVAFLGDRLGGDERGLVQVGLGERVAVDPRRQDGGGQEHETDDRSDARRQLASGRHRPAIDPAVWNYYIAFNLFRIAAIAHGVGRRAHDGNASNAAAAEVGRKAGPIAQVAAFAERCRFRDCAHESEPGCGVLGAVESGELPAAYCEQPAVGAGVGNDRPLQGFVDEIELVRPLAEDLVLDEPLTGTGRPLRSDSSAASHSRWYPIATAFSRVMP
mgnify:CR=1 FL=1